MVHCDVWYQPLSVFEYSQDTLYCGQSHTVKYIQVKPSAARSIIAICHIYIYQFTIFIFFEAIYHICIAVSREQSPILNHQHILRLTVHTVHLHM